MLRHSLWDESRATSSTLHGIDTADIDPAVTDQSFAQPHITGTEVDNDEVELLVVGAGFTGLWTAWHYLQLHPNARIVVVESRHVGFGASGRNGGWCSSYLPMSLDRIAALSDASTAVRLQRLMHTTVDEIGDFVRSNGIDCDWSKAGAITAARTLQQEHRLREILAEARRFGLGDEHVRALEPDESESIVRMRGTSRAIFQPACAALHPRKLVDGLAKALRSRGVTIVEGTEFVDSRALPGRGCSVTVRHRDTPATILARSVALCTEAWTSRLRGRRRTSIPLYSLMIATAPLSVDQWDEIGLDERTVFADARRLIIYGQRTADGRLAFGGRGASYHWGSTIEDSHDHDDSVARHLRDQLVDLFPTVDGTEITHHWGGPLAASRDWTMSVEWDPTSRVGRAGNYVGDGVASSHLAGRTLAEAIAGADTERTSLPLMNHRSPRWEPEPFRWLGINLMTRLAASIDRREARSTRERVLGSGLLDRLTGG